MTEHSKEKQTSMANRRIFLKALTLAASVSSSSSYLNAAVAETSSPEQTRGEPTLKFDSSVPVVQTSSGQIRGCIRNGVHTFKGIPYGASTAGDKRFLPPAKPQPWTIIRNTVAYGYERCKTLGPFASTCRRSPPFGIVECEGNLKAMEGTKAAVINVWTPVVPIRIHGAALHWSARSSI